MVIGPAKLYDDVYRYAIIQSPSAIPAGVLATLSDVGSNCAPTIVGAAIIKLSVELLYQPGLRLQKQEPEL